MCGLTCALALARTGIHAQVFEAAVRRFRHQVLSRDTDRRLVGEVRRDRCWRGIRYSDLFVISTSDPPDCPSRSKRSTRPERFGTLR